MNKYRLNCTLKDENGNEYSGIVNNLPFSDKFIQKQIKKGNIELFAEEKKSKAKQKTKEENKDG